MPVAGGSTLSSKISRGPLGPSLLRDNILLIVGALTSAALIFGLLYDVFDGALRRWSDRDLSRRAHIIGVAVQSHAQNISSTSLQRALDSLAASDDVAGLVSCTSEGTRIAAGPLPAFECRSGLALAAIRMDGKPVHGTIGDRRAVVSRHPFGPSGHLFVVQDRTAIDARRKHLLQALFVAAEGALLALLLLARAGTRIGSRRTEEAARSVVRQMRSSDGGDTTVPAHLRLLVRDMRDTVDQLRYRQTGIREGGAEKLRAFAAREIPAGGLVVIANREPYSHEWALDGQAVVKQPASGLVTAIEPMLRACGGTWIAHGSGSADRAHTDVAGRLAVPPDAPEYTLRRLWIDEQDYRRYYVGLANEGLWPLCHMAHAQPVFRPIDWVAYQAVNETFARAAAEEASSEGLVLIQDYHFALVPRMIRNQAPHIITSIFWHIPWPNPEVAGICPWKEALLEGMLGADIVGFHTKRYCLNFLESAQRYLECRVDLEEMSIWLGGHRTLVRAYPISVEWPYPAASPAQGEAIRRTLGIESDVHVSLGVDRADYTKGLVERIAAVELLLEENPSLVGKYVFLQIASPTRACIRKYQMLAGELKEIAARVNERFGTASWKPVLLQMKTLSPDEVRSYYRMADSAVITPLHDGMNLVAKEYVAACDDGDGALVLSEFAGAARELDAALIVNPYDVEQVAHAILRAIRMPIAERRARMQAMRAHIAAHSIYDWSESLLTDMTAARTRAAGFWPGRMMAAEDGRRVFVR